MKKYQKYKFSKQKKGNKFQNSPKIITIKHLQNNKNEINIKICLFDNKYKKYFFNEKKVIKTHFSKIKYKDNLKIK